MKKILFVVVLLGAAITTQAQSEKYVGAMAKNIASIGEAFSSKEKLVELSQSFERIATAEKTEWLPYYYAALFQVNAAFRQADMSNGDEVADKANVLLMKADALNPKNSEISTVKSMIGTLHMLVNPMQRYMQYAGEIEGHLQAAMQQDPSNPRPFFLKAQTLKNTPENFGGGCDAAKPLAEKAVEKYKSFKPASELSPSWGQAQTEEILADCK